MGHTVNVSRSGVCSQLVREWKTQKKNIIIVVCICKMSLDESQVNPLLIIFFFSCEDWCNCSERHHRSSLDQSWFLLSHSLYWRGGFTLKGGRGAEELINLNDWVSTQRSCEWVQSSTVQTHTHKTSWKLETSQAEEVTQVTSSFTWRTFFINYINIWSKTMRWLWKHELLPKNNE